MKCCFLFFRWPNQRPHFTDYDEPQSCQEEIQVRQTFQKSNIKDVGIPILSFPRNAFFLFGSFVCFLWNLNLGIVQTIYLNSQRPQISFLGRQCWKRVFVKLLWPAVKKNCSSDRKYLLKFEAEWKNDIFWIHQL